MQSGRTVRQSRPDPLEEVEADEHKLHGIASVRITIDGIKKVIPTERRSASRSSAVAVTLWSAALFA